MENQVFPTIERKFIKRQVSKKAIEVGESCLIALPTLTENSPSLTRGITRSESKLAIPSLTRQSSKLIRSASHAKLNRMDTIKFQLDKSPKNSSTTFLNLLNVKVNTKKVKTEKYKARYACERTMTTNSKIEECILRSSEDSEDIYMVRIICD